MAQVSFRFFGDLNGFLAHPRRDVAFEQAFEGAPSVKHLIEAAGVPHTEVAHILVDGQPVGFEYAVQPGNQIEVYPAADERGNGLQDPPGSAIFILDNHLGKLATYLRILGFDSLYRNDYDDETLANISSESGRILLTRDRRLLMRKMVRYGYLVRHDEPKLQVVEVLRRFGLAGQVAPFRRCLRCNHLLDVAQKEAILHRLEPLTRRYFEDFRICPACDQIYWRGSHFDHMERFVREVLGGQEDLS